MTMIPLYRLENLTFRYGRRTALAIGALEIPAEALLCVTGANGAGKSTLLQLLALLQVPSSGRVWVDGRPVPPRGRARRELRRSITLVHQQPLLLRGSVADNLTYGLRLRGLGRSEQLHRCSWALQSVGLAGFAQRPAGALSGGETRRVALARALALQPRVLLLDEPFAGLDPLQAGSFESLLSSLQRRGQTIILTTHDPKLAERLEAPTIHLHEWRLANQSTSLEKQQCRPRLKMHEA